MSTDFRYIFEKGSKKHICPGCGKKSFVRYIDTQVGQYLPTQYGRCDHESHCGYYLSPYKGGYTSAVPDNLAYMQLSKPHQQPVYYLPESILNDTLKAYEKNIFVQNLLKLAPAVDIEKIISLYRIGTIAQGNRAGAATFPFIDKLGNIRTIQAKQFDEANHTISTDFVHSIIARHYSYKGEPLPAWLQDYTKNEKFVTCLFGEHLLNKFPLNPVALVEAPKTAIIGTLYYGLPATSTDLLWLAVYNKSSLTFEKCKALKGRKVVMFPDLNAFTAWNSRSLELKLKLPGTRFIVSDILEKYANETERNDALDLADYLIQFDINLFRKQSTELEQPSLPILLSPPIPEPESNPIPKQDSINENSENSENVKQSYFGELNKSNQSIFNKHSESWDNEIQSIESFFNSILLPPTPIRLDQCTVITNLPKFISSHMATLHSNNGNPVFLPYLQRLQNLKSMLS